MRSVVTLAVVAALVLSQGCIDDFDPGTLIASTRVLGARVQVVGADPERAWPRPGERAHVQWWAVSPGASPMFGSVFLSCPAARTRFGLEQCAGAVAPAESCEPRDRGPCVAVDVPPAEALGDAREMLLLGGICADGEPALDPESRTFACEGDGAEGTPATLNVRVARDDAQAANRHPALAHVLLGGASWAPPPPGVLDAPAGPCPTDVDLPVVPPASQVQVAAVPTSDSFEDFQVEVDGRTTLRAEELQISHFSTEGDLDQQFVFVRAPAPQEEVGWRSPAGRGPEGLLVRFHFVLRDGRGGSDWASRALCVR